MRKNLIIVFIIILIIVLIALGVYFFKGNENNNNSNSDDNATMINNASEELTEQAKSIFNSNFDIYVGKDITSSQIKQLMASVRHSNENSNIRQVTLLLDGEETLDSSKIKTSKKYSVDFEYDDKGLISKVLVETT